MVNTKALKKKMIDKDITSAELSRRCEVSPSKMSLSLNNKRPINLSLAERIQGVLEIDDRDFAFYFLNR